MKISPVLPGKERRDRGRCLFLAPMKPPGHPNPSGDRMVARQFLALLGQLGYKVEIPSTLRTYLSDPGDLPALLAAASREIADSLAREHTLPPARQARFVFTYHNYYKAPDLIGPALARALGIPYVIAESSRAPIRARGEWAQAHDLAEAASDAAAVIFAPTARDMMALEELRPAHQHVVALKPFIDLAEWPNAIEDKGGSRTESLGSPVRLLSVAMMRFGVKIQSYQFIASVLSHINSQDWRLDIVGDGEGRADVERLFSSFGERVRFYGMIDDQAQLSALYRRSDIFVWPGVGEAFGMAYLEAQAHGLACMAYDYGGVADVVADGVSGFLLPPKDEAGFASKLDLLIADGDLRERFSHSARRQVECHHSFEAAGAVLAGELRRSVCPDA